jgi:hypothetical protein
MDNLGKTCSSAWPPRCSRSPLPHSYQVSTRPSACTMPSLHPNAMLCAVVDTPLQIFPIDAQVFPNARTATATASKHISALPVFGYTHVAAR